jgi:DnaJ like chaperone protein
MAKYGKWIGGGLGWAFGGPIGGIVGFLIGSVYDSSSKSKQNIQKTGQGDFAVSLLVISSVVMKANQKIKKSELDYVKGFLVTNFGKEKAQEALLMLREILKQDVPVEDVCRQLRVNMDIASRLQLMHYLFGIANADGFVDTNEVATIERIAQMMGIRQQDFISVKNMFVKDQDASYKILEIEKDAGNDDVKKAYRKMAVKYHPDKVAHLGEDVQKAAKEKFQKVVDAYDNIKKERGMS